VRDEDERQLEMFPEYTGDGTDAIGSDVDVGADTANNKEGIEKGKETPIKIRKETRNLNVDAEKTFEDACLYWG
jgi:hypothetical protein